MTRPPIHRAYATLLCNLADNGGSAELDQHSRCVVGPSRSLIPGEPYAWLKLVAEGFIAGEGGKILLTETGRAEAQRYSEGCTTGV
jgi:hypothetical protein